MSDFGIQLGDDRRVILRFEQFPAAVHDRLLATLTAIEQRLEAAIIAAEPAGATGQLRAITGGRVYDHGARIAAVVGVRADGPMAAGKAGALEYGSHRALVVRAHQAKLAHFWSRAIAAITVDVAAHSRMSNIDPRRFLRDPVEAIRSEAIAEMRAALDAAVADVS